MRERVQENVPKREREQARECVREWVCVTERESERERKEKEPQTKDFFLKEKQTNKSTKESYPVAISANHS